jgi:hypothetical protein
MAKARRKSDSDSAEAVALPDGMIPDFITGNPVKETAKELVRQEVARALLQEYRISADDMEPDFAVKADGKRRKIDVAMFAPGQPHTEEHLERVVICRPQPKVGKRSVIKLSDHKQADDDLNGKPLTRSRKVRSLEIDDDFPAIIDAYWEFRRKNRDSHDYPH